MATATGAYVTLTAAKARLGISSADTTDDAEIQVVCDQVNGYIESFTGRVIAPAGSATYTFDGFDALDNRVLFLPKGIRSISLLETTTYTGGPWYTVPAGNYFLRPTDHEKDPAFPHTEVVMTNVPTAGNYSPLFYNGYDTVRVTGLWGFAAIPDEIKEIAEVMAVRAWSARQAGQTDQIGVSELGQPVISRTLSIRDRDTLQRYRLKRPVKV
jgi:hypothetical protein